MLDSIKSGSKKGKILRQVFLKRFCATDVDSLFENFWVKRDTSLPDKGYFNTGWDTQGDSLYVFLGKKKEKATVVMCGSEMAYIIDCANPAFDTAQVAGKIVPVFIPYLSIKSGTIPTGTFPPPSLHQKNPNPRVEDGSPTPGNGNVNPTNPRNGNTGNPTPAKKVEVADPNATPLGGWNSTLHQRQIQTLYRADGARLTRFYERDPQGNWKVVREEIFIPAPIPLGGFRRGYILPPPPRYGKRKN